MKRILSVVLTLIMALGLIPTISPIIGMAANDIVSVTDITNAPTPSDPIPPSN